MHVDVVTDRVEHHLHRFVLTRTGRPVARLIGCQAILPESDTPQIQS